jgi:hypothetical protein
MSKGTLENKCVVSNGKVQFVSFFRSSMPEMQLISYSLKSLDLFSFIFVAGVASCFSPTSAP